MIESSRFVYVTLNKQNDVRDKVKTILTQHGFKERQILFESPAKFGQEGDYMAIYMPNTKKLHVDKIRKAKSIRIGMTDHGDFVESGESVFWTDLSD